MQFRSDGRGKRLSANDHFFSSSGILAPLFEQVVPVMGDDSRKPDTETISVTLKVLQDAAAQGNAKAAYQLGIMYANGDEVELQYSRAVEYISQAAEAGLVEAMSTLAWLYANGLGVQQDDEKTRYWYFKAAEFGEPKDQYMIATMYRFAQFGAQRDHQKALEWYYKAADQGFPPAQFALGKMLMDGKHIEKDLVRAFQWLSLAVANGSKRAGKAMEELVKQMTPEQFNHARAEMLSAAGNEMQDRQQ
jgi:TPR repeat protein